MTQGFAGKDVLLVRVVKTAFAEAPQGLEQKIDRRTVKFDSENAGDINTVREFVVEDLERLEAMKKAGAKASELVELAEKTGWETAIEKLNKAYAETEGIEANKTSETFTLEKRSGIRRVTPVEMIELKKRYQGDPMARELLARNNVERLLIDKFYALVPPDANALPKSGVIVEFDPTLSFYCVKDLVIHQMTQEQYARDKGLQIARDDFDNAQVLAVTYYNPENITRRMNFKLLQQAREKEAGSPAEANEANEAAE